MSRNARSSAGVIALCFLAALVSSQILPAQDHVVSTASLRHAMISAAATRNANIDKVEKFLDSAPVQKVVTHSGFNLKEIKRAVPTLNDQELAQLAKTSDKAQRDFAAGRLTHGEMTAIIAGGIIVVIILALKA